MDLEDEVVVVTGAASGIGEAMVGAFLDAGARVVAADVNKDALERVGNAAGADDNRLDVRLCDVSDGAQVQALMDGAAERFGKLTVACNNAGISMAGTILETEPEEFDRIIAVNLRGIYLGCRSALPHMLRAGRGSLINTGSANSLVAERYLSAYCASKGGVLMLTKAIAVDFADQGIRCNCLCPGWVETPINEPHIAALGGREVVMSTLGDAQPIGRAGLPEEVASVAVFLASPGASLITGAAIPIDGGMTAW